MAVLNKKRAAKLIVESIFYGDKPTVKRFGLSIATLDNYRRRLNTDDELVILCQEYRAKFETEWISELPIAAKGIIRAITRASQEINIENASDAREMAEALKIVAEVFLAEKIINAQLGRYTTGEDEENGENSATLLLTSPEEINSP